MNASIYICGQGSYREPRLLELQYLRILRYKEALEKKFNTRIYIDKVYIDINFPRTDYIDELSNHCKLIEKIKNGEISTVIVDISIGQSFHPYRYYPIISSLENAGAKVYNCYYDDEEALSSRLEEHFGNKVDYNLIPDDIEGFVVLFPALAGNIILEVIRDISSNIDDNDVSIKHIYKEIDILKNKNPYNGNKLPWLGHRTIQKLLKLHNQWLEERRKVEDIYVLGPNRDLVLWDEDYDSVRDKENREWIIDRIRNLGFNHIVNDNKHSFTIKYNDYIVFEDPRKEGSIEILVYENNTYRNIGSFKILDGWKNDLKEKLIVRVQDLIQKYEKEDK